MENHTISDDQIFGRSAYNSDYSMYGAENARLHSSWGHRSDPTLEVKANIIGIDLRKEMVITGIATQGYGDPVVAEWVDSFNVIYKDSSGKRQGVKNTQGNLMVGLKKKKKKNFANLEFSLPKLRLHVILEFSSPFRIFLEIPTAIPLKEMISRYLYWHLLSIFYLSRYTTTSV